MLGPLRVMQLGVKNFYLFGKWSGRHFFFFFIFKVEKNHNILKNVVAEVTVTAGTVVRRLEWFVEPGWL